MKELVEQMLEQYRREYHLALQTESLEQIRETLCYVIEDLESILKECEE